MAIFNNRPQIIGINGMPVGNGGLMGNRIPIQPTSTMPTFPTQGIMDRDTPLNPPDTGLMALKRPTTPELDAYKAYLRNAPTREGNHLSKWGNLLAGVSGVAQAAGTKDVAGGINTAYGLMDKPYLQKMKDYNEKGGRLKELSDLEYRGLSDEDKRNYQAAEMNLKIREQLTKEFKANSDVGVNDAQIAKIANDIQNGNKRFEKDTKSGTGYIVDLNTNTRTPMGQFAESAAETRAGNLADDIKKLGVQHANALGLENAKFGHDTYLHTLDNDAKANLEKLKDKLGKAGMNETQKNAAFEGAFKETITFNPGLAGTLFKVDPQNGDTVPIDRSSLSGDALKAYDAAKIQFNNKLGQRVNARRGSQIEDQGNLGKNVPSPTNTPNNNVPSTSSNTDAGSFANKITGQELQRVKETISEWNKAHPEDQKDDNDPNILQAVAGKLGIAPNASPINTPTIVPNIPVNNAPISLANQPHIGPTNISPSLIPAQTGISQNIPNVSSGQSGIPQVNIPANLGQSGISQVNLPTPDVPVVRPPIVANNNQSIMQPNNNSPMPIPQQATLGDASRGLMNSQFLRANPRNIQEFKDVMEKTQGMVFRSVGELQQAWNQFRANAIENIGNSPLMGGPGTRQAVR